MSKLELKHLAPYLPYKLKCQYEGIINGKELSAFDKKFRETDIFAIPKEDYVAAVIGQKAAELKEIKVFKNYWTAHIGVKRRGLKTFVNGRDFKPILHPLSDLVKPCLPEGKIPIVELAKINDKHLPEPTKVYSEKWESVLDGEIQFNCDYIVKTSNMGDLVYQFSYWKNMHRFSLRDNTRRVVMAVARQLDLFEWLFEHHFDVYGLIEQDLAVDINTLKK